MLLLMGCAAELEPETPSIPYQFDAGGVQLLDRNQRIDFGRTDHSSVTAMSKLVGRPPVDDGLCGELRRVVWSDGATLFFAGNEFRGWRNLDASAGRVCNLS